MIKDNGNRNNKGNKGNKDNKEKQVINELLSKALGTSADAKNIEEQDAVIDSIFFRVGQGVEKAGYQCPKCHKIMWRTTKIFNGDRTGFNCPHCGYQEDAEDKDKKQKELEIKARYHDSWRYLNHYSATTVNDITGKTFNNYVPKNDESRKAVETCKRMVDAINEGQIIHGLISGPTGVGKTHLACAIINRLMVRSGYYAKIIFISINQLADLRKSGIDNLDIRRRVDGVIDETKKADLVVIDDLGTEYNTDWNKSTIDKIMEFRENKNLIVTTNLKQSGDENSFSRYSDRTKSRLRYHMKSKNGNYVVVFNDTEDYRTGEPVR